MKTMFKIDGKLFQFKTNVSYGRRNWNRDRPRMVDMNDPSAIFNVKLADVGCVVFTNQKKRRYIQTIQFRAPEYGCIDLSASHRKKKLLFDTKRSAICSEDSHLLCLILVTLGEFRKRMKTEGRDSKCYFNQRGHLSDFPEVKPLSCPLLHLIKRAVSWPEQEIADFHDLLINMLNYDPKTRFTVDQALLPRTNTFC